MGKEAALKTLPKSIMVWLLLTALLTALLFAHILQQQYVEYRSQQQLLITQMQQRLDLHESILFGVSALSKATKTTNIDDVRVYSREMQKRYPHLYVVEYQPKISHKERAAFEAAQSKEINGPYTIKDYDFVGARTWNPAPERAFYYPVIFMEPSLNTANEVYGLDLYGDAVFRHALDKATSMHEPHASAPFELVEGDRGYLFLMPLTLNDAQTTTEGMISLLVRSQLLLPNDIPAQMRVRLRHPHYTNERGLIIDRPAQSRSFLPAFSFIHQIGNNRQPFILFTQWYPNTHGFPLVMWFLPPLLALIFTLMILSARQQRRMRENAEAEAKIAMARMTEEARAAELEKRLRERESELHRLDRFNTMGELVAGIAHEIKQPLTSILSYNEACIMLLDKKPNNIETLRHAMQRSAAEATRAANIIQRLRNFIGRQQAKQSNVYLSDIVKDTVVLLGTALDRIEIHQEWPEQEPMIYGDNIQLSQIILNILKNAIDAFNEANTQNPRIRLHATILDQHLQLFIQDNGPGLDAEKAAQLFHPFVTTKAEGLGLGLNISRRIAEQHGGSLTVVHTINGACFCLRLPVTPITPDLVFFDEPDKEITHA